MPTNTRLSQVYSVSCEYLELMVVSDVYIPIATVFNNVPNNANNRINRRLEKKAKPFKWYPDCEKNNENQMKNISCCIYLKNDRWNE